MSERPMQVGDYVFYFGSRVEEAGALAVITKLKTLMGVPSVVLRLERSGQEVTTVRSCVRAAERQEREVATSSPPRERRRRWTT